MQIGVDYVRPDDGHLGEKHPLGPALASAICSTSRQDKPTSQGGPTINISTGQVGEPIWSTTQRLPASFCRQLEAEARVFLNIGVRVDNYGEGIRHTERSDPGCYLFAGQGSNTMESDCQRVCRVQANHARADALVG